MESYNYEDIVLATRISGLTEEEREIFIRAVYFQDESTSQEKTFYHPPASN